MDSIHRRRTLFKRITHAAGVCAYHKRVSPLLVEWIYGGDPILGLEYAMVSLGSCAGFFCIYEDGSLPTSRVLQNLLKCLYRPSKLQR